MDENLLLSLIENNAKMEVVDLAAALNETEENVDKTIKDLEKNKTIYGYHTLINWDKTNHDVCTAVIQVNAKPERDYGYDRIAKKIYNFPEVDTMYLLAGNYEFLLIVKGKTMVEVAKFVNSLLLSMLYFSSNFKSSRASLITIIDDHSFRRLGFILKYFFNIISDKECIVDITGLVE